MNRPAQQSTPDITASRTGRVDAPMGPTMRAVFQAVYGAIDGLQLQEVATPVVANDDVLVRVRAAALHVGDCFAVRGKPYAMRIETGLLKPRSGVPGFDLAGRVEAIGQNVTRFSVGDEVFGSCTGACAEFAIAKESTLAKRPNNLTHAQAAAISTSGLAALHALRDVARLKPDQKVLINGAAGGVGTFAVQLANSMGAEVTGVCSQRNVALVRSLGAHHVVDYEREDYTEHTARYDLILDNIENRSLTENRRALAPRGMLIVNSGTGVTGFAMFVRLIRPILLSPFVGQELKRYLSMPKHADLVVLKELIEEGKLSPVIDTVFPLQETVRALHHIDAGHARGKVVIEL